MMRGSSSVKMYLGREEGRGGEGSGGEEKPKD